MASGPRYGVLLAIGCGSFMAALDASIVNTALPVIAAALGAHIDAAQWVVTVFLLVVSGLMLSFGRLGDLHGHKRIYLSGFGLFVIASGLCGVAPTIGFLVAARALQAVGAGVIIANSAAILTQAFPPTERGRALGLQAALTYLGLTVGPSLGGLLVGWFSWRVIFYVNLPVGALAWLLALRFIPKDGGPRGTERFDVPGALLFMTGLVALLLALNQGHAWGWSATPTVALIALAPVLLAAFLWRESHTAAPMLDLSLFRTRLFSASAASAVLNYISIYALSFLLPFYLVQLRGMTPQHAGALLSIQPLVMAVAAPISGILSDRIDTRILSSLGMAVLAGGLVLFSRVGAATGMFAIAVALAVCGLGTGLFIAPNNSALMGAAPRGRQGIAAGIMATARNTGMMLGIAQAGAIYTTVLAWRGDAFAGIGTAFFAAGCVAGVGVFTSALRGS